MTNTKKSLALFAALALIIQALFIALGSQLMLSAETANSYSVEYIETITNDELAALGYNLISGKMAAPYTIDADGNRKSVLGNSTAKDNLGEADTRLLGLTDGNVSTTNEMMTAQGQPIKPLCLEYVLDDSAVIGRFFMVGASNGTLNTSAYEVYLSESKDELYSAANCIYSYDHTKDGIHGGQIVTFDKSLRGSFLAVKITKPTIANWNQAGHHARIAEIAVYGQSTYDVDYVETVTKEDVSALGTSLIAGKKAAPYTDGKDGALKSMLGNSSNEENLGDADTRLAGLTDGSVDKINEMMTAYGQPIKPLYLEYDLGVSCSVEKFFMVGQNTKDLNTGAYEVYLADSRETLYDPENLIYTYDHTKNGIHGGQLVTFNTEPEGSYLAVKITKPTIDNLDQAGHHARIYEIGLYGKATYSTEYVNTATNEDVAALGTSLIAGKKAAPYTDGENGTLKSMLGNSSNEENLGDADARLVGLTDGNVDKVNEMMTAYGQPIKPLYLEYDLGVSSTVEKFFMLGTANGSLNTSAYEVYLADNRDTLYSAENCIYSYDHTKDGVHGGQIVTFNAKLKGSFLGVKITRPTVTNLDQPGYHARIFEIAVFGTPVYTVTYRNTAASPRCVSDDELQSEGNSLIAGKKATPYTMDSDGNRKMIVGNSVQHENLYNPNGTLLGLTDGIVGATKDLTYFGGALIKPLYLEYDFGASCRVDKFLMVGWAKAYNEDNSRFTGIYNVYVSDNQETLYNAENRVYSYDYSKNGIAGGQIVSFAEAYCGRYLAIEILKSVTTQSDEYAGGNNTRISEIAVYGARVYNAPGDINGDGFVNEQDSLSLRRLLLNIVSPDISEIGYYDVNKDGKRDIRDLVSLDERITTATDTFSVRTNQTLYTGFQSFGANISIGNLTAAGQDATGMNDVWFEVDKERYLAAKPQFSRVLFFPDYMVTNEESDPQRTDWQNNVDYQNYKNGIYDFNSAEMNALYRYLDLIKECGGKFYINFGFGVSNRIKQWFSIDGVESATGSAPRDNQLYANACVALLKELKRRGYDNLIGVSFYNEPNGNGFQVKSGLKADKIAYYNDIINRVSDTLVAQGLDVDIFAAEISNVMTNDKFGNYTFLKGTAGNSKVDAATFHMYYWTLYGDAYGIDAPVNAGYIQNLAQTLNSELKKPLYLTEFNTGNYDYGNPSPENSSGGEWTWDTSNASLFITCANAGIRGAARWNYACSYWTDPFNNLTDKQNNYESLWLNATSIKNVEYGVLDKFYEESLLTNYVKAGSEVLGSTADNSNDTRIAAFRLPDGNYTVVVEVKGGSQRNLSISFDRAINKTFYRMSFNHLVKNNGNATVRACEKVFDTVGSSIVDSVGEEYAYYVYTTCTPIKQLELDRVTASVVPGESVAFIPAFVDCQKEDLIWTVSASTGSYSGTVSNGVYTADANAKSGDLIAVKVALKSDPLTYAIAVVALQ